MNPTVRPADAFAHLAKAVEHGFDNFRQIMTSTDLFYLREQESFQSFAQQGYNFSEPLTPANDTISKLERLAQLKAEGLLTNEEFEAQKKRLLAR